MSDFPPLIADLALILICAGVITIIFRRLKQPLVLGYIVAGFIASPHTTFTPSVVDEASIHIWAEIGVIFLLFSIGMEFSIKKLMKSGSSAIIAFLILITTMMIVGVLVGVSFGWKRMDCIYLGGMIAMSSTTIIYKAFDDLGLRQQHFATLVISVLILEDIFAVVLMVLLSTMAVSQNVEGTQLVYCILKLVFYLILWFTVGIFLIPLFLKKCRKWMSDETLLVVSLALCFGMVVLASQAGFSAAFGAFIMGSILAETVDVERIEHLVSPVKDLFGAVFFVSVGMMADASVIADYWLPILVITLVILIGNSLLGTVAFLISGQSLKVSTRCGFSLAQIGEFSFIIASLGMSLGVISNFLYPIVVAVSVLTAFTSPYMIRFSEPLSKWLERKLPPSWITIINNYSAGRSATTSGEARHWRKLVLSNLMMVVLFSVLCIGIIVAAFHFSPLLAQMLPLWASDLLSVIIIIAVLSPFLYALIMKNKHSRELLDFFKNNRYYRAMLISLFILRIVIAMVFVIVVVSHFYHLLTAILVTVVIATIFILSIKRTKRLFKELERVFIENLNSREINDMHNGRKKPKYAVELLDRDLHLLEFEVPMESAWGGMTLKELNLAQKYGVHIASLLRGSYRINIPGGNVHVFPGDKIQVIGSDEQLDTFGDDLKKEQIALDESNLLEREMIFRQLVIESGSSFIDKTIIESGIRDTYQCLVVGFERDGIPYAKAPIRIPLKEGDILRVVGEKKQLKALKTANSGRLLQKHKINSQNKENEGDKVIPL